MHLLTPTYVLFPEIAQAWTETRLRPEDGFRFDLGQLVIPPGTTLAVIVNPNNPNGGTFDVSPLPGLLRRHPTPSSSSMRRSSAWPAAVSSTGCRTTIP